MHHTSAYIYLSQSGTNKYMYKYHELQYASEKLAKRTTLRLQYIMHVINYVTLQYHPDTA